MCSELGLEAAICDPPEQGGQVRCAAPHQMVLFLAPCPQDATVLDFQVPYMNCVTLTFFKERGFSSVSEVFPLFYQKQNSMFVPSCQSWSVQHIWEQFKFHTKIKLLEKSQSWKQSRKSYYGRSFQKTFEKKKRIKPPNTVWQSWGKPRPEWTFWSQNYCHLVKIKHGWKWCLLITPCSLHATESLCQSCTLLLYLMQCSTALKL